MSRQLATYSCAGGLNLVDPAIAVSAGQAIFCKNFESDIRGGYRRCDGYASFDGSAAPQVVPGSGPVRGVFWCRGKVYAFRDNAGGTACVMHSESVTGWQAVELGGFIRFGSGTAEIKEGDTITGGTSGATALVKRVGITGAAWTGTMTGHLTLSGVTGTFQSGELIKVGGAAKATSTSAYTTHALLPGGAYHFDIWNFKASAGSRCIYGVDGKNPAFEFDGTTFAQIETGMVVDAPKYIACHKNYLWLGFTGGSLQYSAPIKPHTWNVTLGSGEIGIGSEITGMSSFKGDVLVVTGSDGVFPLYGASSATFQLKSTFFSGGCLPNTLVPVGSDLMFMVRNGLVSIQSTTTYGDFIADVVSAKVRGKINTGQALAAFAVPDKSQYRLIMDDGDVWVFTLFGDHVETMKLTYPDPLQCAFVCRDDSGNQIVLGGAQNGKLLKMEIGATSFDGAEIESILRLAFNMAGTVCQRKRFHFIELDIWADEVVSIDLATEFDIGSSGNDLYSGSAFGGGGYTGGVNYGGTYIGASVYPAIRIPIYGVGENISPLVRHVSATSKPFLISTINLQFTPRGQTR